MPRKNGVRQSAKPPSLEQLSAEAEALQRASDQQEREWQRRSLQPSDRLRWESAVIDVYRDPTNDRGETPGIREAWDLQAQAWHRLGILLREPGFNDVAQRVEELAPNHDEARNAAVELFHDAARGTSIDELVRRIAAFAGREKQCRYRKPVSALAEEVWSGKPPCTMPVPEDDSASQQGTNKEGRATQEVGATARPLPIADAQAAPKAEVAADPQTPRLVLDPQTFIVTLDGTPHGPLTPSGFGIVKALSDAQGHILTSSDLKSVPGCKGDEKTIRNHIDRLPEALRSCIQAKPGSGRWLRLPPRK